jgi:hypothetical protein
MFLWSVQSRLHGVINHKTAFFNIYRHMEKHIPRGSRNPCQANHMRLNSSGTRLLLAAAYRACCSQKSVAVRNLKASDVHDTSTCCWFNGPSSLVACFQNTLPNSFRRSVSSASFRLHDSTTSVVSMKAWQQCFILSSERRDTWQEHSSPSSYVSDGSSGRLPFPAY